MTHLLRKTFLYTTLFTDATKTVSEVGYAVLRCTRFIYCTLIIRIDTEF